MHRILYLFLCCCLTTLASAQDFYNNSIQEVRVELPYKNYDYKLDSLKKANPEARLTGYALVNGARFDSVGIRYKGNSSYFRSRKETYRKLPVNIRLDYKIRGQHLKGGYNTLKLSNAFLDPSFIRDPLSYELVRKYMPAPMCNFAKLYVNNRYQGLYVNTESIDAVFIQKFFGTTKGYLVKCDPDNWQRVRSQSGCPKGENASLAYLNDNTGCYDAFYEVDDPAAWKPLLNLIKTLNKTPDKIETTLDVDQTLWMLALNNVMVNLDSYNGSLSHNYYLWFDSTNVAHPLIWDLNMSFGGWRRNFSFEELKDEELIQYNPLAEFDNPKRPLISKLLKNPLYRKIYLAHMKTIVKENLENGQLMTRAQAMAKEIDAHVKADTVKLYPYLAFQQSFDKTMTDGPDNIIGLKQLMDKRTQYLLKHPLLTKIGPAISEVKHKKTGETVMFSAKGAGAKTMFLCYRSNKALAFARVPMTDDGANGDAAAGDGVFSVTLPAAKATQYYIIGENDEAVSVLPERASYEYLKVD
jgi:hypothetical protein